MLQSNHASSGMFEHERPAVLHHRRGDHAVREHLARRLARDPALLGQQHAFAEREHLHGEAQVGCDLHEHGLAVAADVGDRRPDVAKDRLDPLERRGVPADHHRELALLERDHAAGHGRVEHLARPVSATRSASSRLAPGLTVLMSM